MSRLLIVLLVVGCSKAEKPVVAPVAPVEPEEPPAEEPVSADFFYELAALMERKRFAVGHCYADGVAAGELKGNEKGGVLVNFTISPQGKAKNVSVGESALSSAALKKCLVETVSSWEYPQPSRDVEHSHQFKYQGGL